MNNIDDLVKEVLKTGKWMLRRSWNGRSYGGFKWSPIGEWTKAPDWNPSPVCGGGLHGNGPESSGYWTDGPDLDFCLIKGEAININGEKLKAETAMVLLRNILPEGLSVGGSLDLRGTQITALPEGIERKVIR